MKKKKNVALATILSIIFPGLGQFYTGYMAKGIIFIVSNIVVAFIPVIGWILTLLIWIYNIIDANRSSIRINQEAV
jgi:TM2 domain-containing membrane protein YozV